MFYTRIKYGFLTNQSEHRALAIDPFQKWRHVMWFREVEDKHQNKSYVSKDRFDGNVEVFA